MKLFNFVIDVVGLKLPIPISFNYWWNVKINYPNQVAKCKVKSIFQKITDENQFYLFIYFTPMSPKVL